ncbi:MAG: hypothetical protein BWZ11_01844 [Bacteroidetes bacterium ADurb.BinA395]|nr:MAG: hypothetical protein BWZ11_01844 [Bacteroidetes bacterium ADurb.BinA395]
MARKVILFTETSSGCLKKLAIAGERKYKSAYKTKAIPMLK